MITPESCTSTGNASVCQAVSHIIMSMTNCAIFVGVNDVQEPQDSFTSNVMTTYERDLKGWSQSSSLKLASGR